ncbi:cytochrome P450 CYP94D108-like [Diospyros lotus]|uniref:cytochrome P450 CYP94D108-like n=1 Tax=Diospyros lotus TaxID=55363 RepID=UPI00224FC1D3|nr:cytochrome P450 CYP94D108-like [Diospyros lotus]
MTLSLCRHFLNFLPPSITMELSLQALIFIFLLSLSLYLLFLHSGKPRSRIHAPGFKLYPLVGVLPEFLQNRHRFLDWTTEVLSRCPTNTAFLRRPGNIKGVITANPLIVEHMLKTNFHNYPKGPRFSYLLRDFLGDGIFNADGEIWKVQRKTASYEFNTKSLRNFVMDSVKAEIQNRLVPIFRKAAQTNGVLDIQDVLERFAFDNICKVAFNVDPGCLGGDGTAGSEFMEAFEDATTLSSGRFLYALPFAHRIKKYFNVGSERKLMKSIAVVHEFADKIIRSRIEGKDERKDEDLLSRFIGAVDESSPEFLRDIVISFILAGRDTTSSALTWFFWILSSRPEIEKNILDELQAIRLRNSKPLGDTYNFDELREMHYLHAAISEAMRLYPPVPVDSKACQMDDVLPDGTLVRKGWFVSYHTYAMGRMEKIWGSDCREFKPERWLENGICKLESPFRFPVFHAGPRICLGKDMAYIQMKSIAASVMERFEIDVQEKDTCPEPLLSLTLRMKGGLGVKVKERRVA